jgi:quercetin dioxygenase-like cupin family protein
MNWIPRIGIVLFAALACTMPGLATETGLATDIEQQAFDMTAPPRGEIRKEQILEGEIPEVETVHVAISGPASFSDGADADHALIVLFVAGQGKLEFQGKEHTVVPETIAMPISLDPLTVDVAAGDTLHFLVVRKSYNEQDLLDMPGYSNRKSGGIYFKKFSDCQAYKEAIKSPKTTSRTVLPNQYIPRVAMGTVETTGPDEVGAHRHPMLDQMFLALAENDVVVTADDTHARFKEFSLLHIPLGSLHGVKAEPGTKLYYMWMDFFLTKEGEEWLKTHKPVTE